MSDEREPFPFDDLHAAEPASEDYRSALTEFRGEYGHPTPDPARLHAHAERVRGFGSVAGPFERWYLSPRVQAFIAELHATGI